MESWKVFFRTCPPRVGSSRNLYYRFRRFDEKRRDNSRCTRGRDLDLQRALVEGSNLPNEERVDRARISHSHDIKWFTRSLPYCFYMVQLQLSIRAKNFTKISHHSKYIYRYPFKIQLQIVVIYLIHHLFKIEQELIAPNNNHSQQNISQKIEIAKRLEQGLKSWLSAF